MFEKKFLCSEELCNISLKYMSYLVYVSNKHFFVLQNYIIYVLEYKWYLIYLSNKLFFVLSNYIIYL